MLSCEQYKIEKCVVVCIHVKKMQVKNNTNTKDRNLDPTNHKMHDATLKYINFIYTYICIDDFFFVQNYFVINFTLRIN